MLERWLFQADLRDERLDKVGYKLGLLDSLIPWESFREILDKLYKNSTQGGRPPYDPVMMLKILVLQSLYNVSDEEMEYQIADRISFQRFLKIEPQASVPDARTIWVFRERLKRDDVYERVFTKFNDYLDKKGYKAQGGQMVDATFQHVPIQRNSAEENAHIKETGKAPNTWSRRKISHKDIDAHWGKKGKNSHFGYKIHINADGKFKLIRKFRVTPANDVDSKDFHKLLEKGTPEQPVEDRCVFADSAYSGEANLAGITQLKLEPRVCEKGYRGHPLTDDQKASNREKSRVRSRVEHVFGVMFKLSRGSRMIYTIGQLRATVKVCLRNLAYNMSRYVTLRRLSGKLCPR